MTRVNIITAKDALEILLRGKGKIAALDVRSENEFVQGSFPQFQNIPILNNKERHEVGLIYRNVGQNEAIALGHRLVSLHRESRIQSWKELLHRADFPFVLCWRGGLRSKIACEWLAEAGQNTLRIEGAYKGLRAEIMRIFEELPDFFVVSGPTGTGKSKLLLKTPLPQLDLETIAHHRGSAFGMVWNSPQPSQASFENALAFALLRQRETPLLVEDESLLIGKVHLPIVLRDKIKNSPVVKIQMSLESRVENLFADYLQSPMAEGISALELQDYYERGLSMIRTRLGGLLESQIRAIMQNAFAGNDPDLHRAWIRELLVHYYDKSYRHAFTKFPRKIAFSGDWLACQQWIQNQYA